MKRAIDRKLIKWINNSSRKVLLIRGARQVGKTYSVRELANHFSYYLEVNFEEEPEVVRFFEGSLNPQMISEKLSAYYNVSIIPGKTLVFLDEIQACPNALKSLRFFYEKMPDLHVAAAGSLLEFTISEIPSFGVGRISSLFMYPMSFYEFIEASESVYLVQMLSKSSLDSPLDNTFHEKLLEKLRTYMIVGGMPAAVDSYCRNHDLRKCQILLDEILTTIQDDFAKYKKRLPVLKLRETFNAIVMQAGRKFKYSDISPGGSLYGFKAALDLLVKAGLAFKVYHTSARGIPLGAQMNDKKFKLILFDIGLHQRALGLELSEFLIRDDIEIVNKGSLAELFVGLELIAATSPYTRPQLFYWHREARSSNAEVDYVVQRNSRVIPLEVKSGKRGGMQSMRLFLQERGLDTGIRLSQENYGSYDNIKVIPIYAAQNIIQDNSSGKPPTLS